MRHIVNPQSLLGQVDIASITFDSRSRDEMPQLLRGLQYIYCNPELRTQVFEILNELVPKNINKKTGRPGMELWKIFVMGTIRLSCGWDYDKLKDTVDNHFMVRQMLGHPDVYDRYAYPLQTIEDNISLFTPEILNRINGVVVKAGQSLEGKKKRKRSRAGVIALL